MNFLLNFIILFISLSINNKNYKYLIFFNNICQKKIVYTNLNYILFIKYSMSLNKISCLKVI